MCKYLTSGGEGDIFEGYYQKDNNENCEDFIFKVYFDPAAFGTEDELEIMNAFEKNINIV